MRSLRRKGAVGAILLALALVGAACSSGDGTEIKVGAQDFGESAILAEIYAQALEADG